jgi:hypothetical protein
MAIESFRLAAAAVENPHRLAGPILRPMQAHAKPAPGGRIETYGPD